MRVVKKIFFWWVLLSLMGLPFAILAIFAGLMLAMMFGGIGIPPQDCELRHMSVQGIVVDGQQTPIPNAQVLINNEFESFKGYEAGKVAFSLRSGTDGRFSQNGIKIFRCDSFILNIQADGYKPLHLEYRAEDALIQSLPKEVKAVLQNQEEVTTEGKLR